MQKAVSVSNRRSNCANIFENIIALLNLTECLTIIINQNLIHKEGRKPMTSAYKCLLIGKATLMLLKLEWNQQRITTEIMNYRDLVVKKIILQKNVT